MKKSVELRGKKAAIWKEANELTGKIEAGTGKLTSEERTKWDKMNSDMADLDQQIKDIELIEARSLEFANNANEVGKAPVIEGAPKGEEKRSYDEQFMEVVRGGMKPEEVRSLNSKYKLGVKNSVEERAITDPQSANTTTNPELGGVLVPTTWASGIEHEMQMWGQVIGAVGGITTTGGGPLIRTYSDDFSKGRIIGENTTTAVKNIEWKNKTWNSYKYTSDEIRVPYELLQDAAYDVGREVTSKTGERIGRILAEHLTTGDGSGKPTGILTAATASGKVTSGATITPTLLTGLEHSLDPAYRPNAKYMFHDSTLEAIKLLDIGSSDARPLWKMSMREGEPDRINGYGYVINNEMPVLTGSVGDKAICFGDLSRYTLRRVGGYRFMRLGELGALEDQIIYVTYARFDGNLLISNSIQTLAVGA